MHHMHSDLVLSQCLWVLFVLFRALVLATSKHADLSRAKINATTISEQEILISDSPTAFLNKLIISEKSNLAVIRLAVFHTIFGIPVMQESKFFVFGDANFCKLIGALLSVQTTFCLFTKAPRLFHFVG